MKKTLLIILTVVICCAVLGTTVALLIAKTNTITNTFTAGDIEITLTETAGVLNQENGKREFQMLPGATIEKDPKVTVKAGSEACYLLVQLVRNSTFDSLIDYTLEDGWTKVSDEYPNVYYRMVGTVGETINADTTFSVFKGDQVTVSKNVTRDDLNLSVENFPMVRITAMAVQRENVDTVDAAILAIIDHIRSQYPELAHNDDNS